MALRPRNLDRRAKWRHRLAMLTLMLLRHAKSNWDNPADADFDRPLAKRGQKSAPRMGAEIAHLGLVPELVLCSSAARTRQTLDLVLGSWPEPHPEVVFDDAIYMATPEDMLAQVRRVASRNPAPSRVMVVGHNPGMEDFASDLAGHGDAEARKLLAQKYPTCALAVLTFEAGSWSDVDFGAGNLERFITPAMLA
ncbi:SixA phosphatase family protein [Hyphomicrobium sulfonivorans]|uniref:SixA phosphatase family protein n=1 Tax=Hyphomicrobium sulfonivorans TaxID=121290 RepID=UPI001FE5938D|nr:histidine phosphatase family protein [Hyphomicrobium sulfonivorans]